MLALANPPLRLENHKKTYIQISDTIFGYYALERATRPNCDSLFQPPDWPVLCCVFMNNFISALLRQLTEVIKLCLWMLVAGRYALVEDRAFAGTSFGPNFDFGK